MLKFAKVPLLFLFIGSLLGLFLRWQFVSPTTGINYSFILHAHSHVMFLGWVFNVLFIGFVHSQVQETKQKIFQYLFGGLQILVVGMLISFPLQGYGFYSILLSTLHTIVAMVFIVAFLQRTKHHASASIWYARLALVFFIISTAGPFSLGYLMANGLGQTKWYYFSIYFYLHFQYNGFFLFGVFSLFFDLLEKRKINFNIPKARKIGTILAVCCAPAYLLSILWTKPGYGINVLGGVAALIQLMALIMLINLLLNRSRDIKLNLSKASVLFIKIVFAGLVIKSFLQLFSSFPDVAQMAYALRQIVIAYLHLVLVGIISLSLLIWYFESNLLNKNRGITIVFLFIFSFVGMEVCLVISPWWSTIFGRGLPSASLSILVFSFLLSLSCFLLLISARKWQADKNHYSG